MTTSRRMQKITMSLPKVRLDWKQYYKEFVERHGPPIVHEGRQLFRDGWTYALASYEGPEYPPPDDPRELRKLQLVYWNRRRGNLRIIVNWLQAQHRTLRTLAESRDGELIERKVEPKTKRILGVGKLDLEPLSIQLKDAKAALKATSIMIEELEG